MNSYYPLRSYLNIGWKIAVLVGFLIAASYAKDWVIGQLDMPLTPSNEPMLHRTIMISISLYVVLMMLPFVPGVEIGLAMMTLFGPQIVPLVYGGTVLALLLSFLIGRLVPQSAIAEILETLHLRRAGQLLRRLEPLAPDARLELLLQTRSKRIVPFLLRHRYLALAVALNLPGNTLFGGGGGISLVAGFSRLLSFIKFALAVAIAVSPVPLLVLLTNMKV